MKLVSKSFVLAAAMMFASAASAGTLYWQVQDDTPDQGAILWAQKSGGEAEVLDGAYDTPTGIVQTDITNYSDGTYLFYVELINYNTGATNSTGYKWGYGDLVSSGYVSMGATDIPTVYANAAAHSNFAAAPEPSSGLLLLIGGAMLALRRRRQK